MPSEQVPRPPGPGSRFYYGYVVVGAALLIMTVTFGAYNSFGIFFDRMLADFNWTRAITSGGFSLSWIMQGLLGIVMGRLNDRFGPRVVLTVSGVLVGLGYLLMSQLSAAWQLYLFYGVIIGSGMGGCWVPLVSTVARWFTKRRTLMTGVVLTGIGIGTLVAAPVISRLISAYDWRMSYIMVGGVVLGVVVLAAQLLRRDPARTRRRAFDGGEQERQESVAETGSLSLRQAGRTRQFWLTSGMFFCFGFCVYTVLTHIVLHATGLGISSTSAANILAAAGGLSIAGRIVLGSAADRFGNRRVFIIGFILMAATLFWLVPARELWALYLFAVVFGFAFGGCATSESPLVAGLFGLRSHGLILGVINLFGFTLGAAVGPLIGGYIFDSTSSYQLAFIVCGALSVAGLILTVLLSPVENS